MRIPTLIIALSLLAACKKSTPEVPAPGKAELLLPAENSLCITGTVVSEGESNVELSWTATPNTDGYQVDIKNLLAGSVTTQLTTATKVSVTLLRNTPYSWSVTSRSTKTEASAVSNTWKFYNAGLGTTSYAPFPAAITVPVFGRTYAAGTTSVNLNWTCSDVDSDIVGYDVYLSTKTSPDLLQANVTNAYLVDVPVQANSVYYFYIIAKDAKGNTSKSDTYFFRVN